MASFRLTKKKTIQCCVCYAFLFVIREIRCGNTTNPFCCVWHSGFIAFMTFQKALINKIWVTVVFATLLLFYLYEEALDNLSINCKYSLVLKIRYLLIVTFMLICENAFQFTKFKCIFITFDITNLIFPSTSAYILYTTLYWSTLPVFTLFWSCHQFRVENPLLALVTTFDIVLAFYAIPRVRPDVSLEDKRFRAIL